MLPDLQAAVVRHGRRRRMQRFAVRGAGTLAVVLLAGTILVRTWPATEPTRIVEAPAPREPVGPRGPFPEILETKPGALDRYSILPWPQSAGQIIDDHQLVTILADIGRPAGLIRAQGDIRLTADVTDAAIAAATPRADVPGAEPPEPGNRHPS
jgi:hypothetical protein